MAEMIAMLNGVGAVPNGTVRPIAPNIDWDWRLKAGPGMVARRQTRIATGFGQAPESDLDTATTKVALWTFLAFLGVGTLVFASIQSKAAQPQPQTVKGLAGRHHRRRTSLGAASKLPMAEGIDKRGKRVKLVVKKQEGEWQVRVYEDGKFKDGPTYYAGGRPEDKQDAIETFHSMKASYGLAGMRRRKGRK